MREIKFRAWDDKSKEIFVVDVLAINPVTWDSGGTGVSLAYQPHIKIMQYAGLKDKNGREIFEGDIVSYFGLKYEVLFKNGAFGWMEDGEFYSFNEMARSEFNKFEIIGNVYENPELLEGME